MNQEKNIDESLRVILALVNPWWRNAATQEHGLVIAEHKQLDKLVVFHVKCYTSHFYIIASHTAICW